MNAPPPPPLPFKTARQFLAWAVFLAVASYFFHRAWHHFDVPERRDGNDGHVSIDFGGQWLMGRLLVEGHGRQLYDRNVQRELLRRAYPRADEAPDQKESDAEQLMGWLMGVDRPRTARTVGSLATLLGGGNVLGVSAVLAVGWDRWTLERLAEALAPCLGGPLYPPLNAFVYAPLALLPPRPSYRVDQVVNLLLLFC